MIVSLNYHDNPVTGVKYALDGKKIVSVDNAGFLMHCNSEIISEKPDDIIF